MCRISPDDSLSRNHRQRLYPGRNKCRTSHAFDCKHFAAGKKLTQRQSAGALCKNCGAAKLPVEEIGKVYFYSPRPRDSLAGADTRGRCRTIAPMIPHLRGNLLAKRPDQAIVETHRDRYDVTITVPTFTEMPAAGGQSALHIHTHSWQDAL